MLEKIKKFPKSSLLQLHSVIELEGTSTCKLILKVNILGKLFIWV